MIDKLVELQAKRLHTECNINELAKTVAEIRATGYAIGHLGKLEEQLEKNKKNFKEIWKEIYIKEREFYNE